MSSAQDIQPFKGGTWRECGAFIQGVRAAAWKEGKLRDPAWMADFASLHLSEYALAWYFRLSPEVQQDWPQLQAAFVERWRFPGGDDFSELLGVPTAADSPDEQLDHPQRAILKVVEAGKEEARYVTMQPDSSRGFGLTSDAGEALRFRFDPQLDPKIFECVDKRPYSWLAVRWDTESLSFSYGSSSHAVLTAVDCATLESLATGRSGPFQIVTFRIAKSGQVIPLWRDDNTEKSLVAFTNTLNLVILTPDANGSQFGLRVPATLFIEKVD